MTENYEQLRDSATGEAGAAWKAADREEHNLRIPYQELNEDPRYTNEYKAEQAWERYEATKEKIAAGKEKARELLKKQARSAERLSFPFPAGEAPITTDTDKLIASQNEHTRIVRKLDRLAASAKAPLAPDRLEVLRGEYGRGRPSKRVTRPPSPPTTHPLARPPPPESTRERVIEGKANGLGYRAPAREYLGWGCGKPRPAPKFAHDLTGIMKANERS